MEEGVEQDEKMAIQRLSIIGVSRKAKGDKR